MQQPAWWPRALLPRARCDRGLDHPRAGSVGYRARHRLACGSNSSTKWIRRPAGTWALTGIATPARFLERSGAGWCCRAASAAISCSFPHDHDRRSTGLASGQLRRSTDLSCRHAMRSR